MFKYMNIYLKNGASLLLNQWFCNKKKTCFFHTLSYISPIVLHISYYDNKKYDLQAMQK